MDAIAERTDLMKEHPGNEVLQIVGNLGRKLAGFVRARVRSDADAEDVLQEVWQRLVGSLEDGPIEHVAAWLYTVARNRIIDLYRKPQMASLDALADEMELNEAVAEPPDFWLRDDSTPETEHQRKAFWEELHAGLAELPPEQRQVFVWHELEGLSFQEIATLTGENLNTLLSRKRYAVLRLRFQQLRNEFLPGPTNSVPL